MSRISRSCAGLAYECRNGTATDSKRISPVVGDSSTMSVNVPPTSMATRLLVVIGVSPPGMPVRRLTQGPVVPGRIGLAQPGGDQLDDVRRLARRRIRTLTQRISGVNRRSRARIAVRRARTAAAPNGVLGAHPRREGRSQHFRTRPPEYPGSTSDPQRLEP